MELYNDNVIIFAGDNAEAFVIVTSPIWRLSLRGSNLQRAEASIALINN